MLLLGSFHHTSAFLASWSKAAGDGLFLPQNWEYIQKNPGSPRHISTVTLAQPESDARALPPTPCAEPNADFTIVSVPVSPSRWLLWGCDPALTGLCAARRLGRIAAGAVPTMAGWCQDLAGTNRDPVFQGVLGGVQSLDSPNSPEMGPAEGTPIPPLTLRTESSDGERGHPQSPTALLRFALGVGGNGDQGQQPAALLSLLQEEEGEKNGQRGCKAEMCQESPCYPRLPPSAHSSATARIRMVDRVPTAQGFPL